MRTKVASVVIVALAAVMGWHFPLLSTCSAENTDTYPPIREKQEVQGIISIINLLSTDTISVLTPYTNRDHILAIHQAYSEDATAPWGFEHRGIDFSPSIQWPPFQAVFSGVIEVVDLYENVVDGKSYWHVNVKLVHDAVWSAWYAFEPMAEGMPYGVEQLLKVVVSEGDYVQAGELMGNLYAASPGAHVHFTLNKNNEAVCPEPYFSPQAAASVLDIIHDDHPTWEMCYFE